MTMAWPDQAEAQSNLFLETGRGSRHVIFMVACLGDALGMVSTSKTAS